MNRQVAGVELAVQNWPPRRRGPQWRLRSIPGEDEEMTHRPARRAGIAALALATGVTLAACSDSPEDTDGGAGVEITADPTTEAAPEATESPEASPEASPAEPDDDASAGASAGASAEPGDGDAAADPTTAALAAIATAEAEAGGTSFSVDRDNLREVWDVEVAVDGGSIEVSVDATGSEVQRTENDDLDAEDRDALDAAQVGLSEAIQRVVGENGGTLDDAELDVDDGAVQWSVTILDADDREQDYLVDAASGEVTRDTDD
jgi:uncharacterized membrane protein YkoI